MKKNFIFGVLLGTLLLVSGCSKTPAQPLTDLNLDDSVVTQNVRGWDIYTNAAYRWEIRVPLTWDNKNSGEDGYYAEFFPRGSVSTAVEFNCKSNWQEKYTLEQYYSKQEKNLWTEYSREDMTLGGRSAVLFRDVKGLVSGSDKTANVVVLDLVDRIVEIRVFDMTPDALTLLNSINFYGDAGIVVE